MIVELNELGKANNYTLMIEEKKRTELILILKNTFNKYESKPKRITTPSGYFYATEPIAPNKYSWSKGKYTLLQWAKMEKNYNLFVW